ncbi:hypothetical protein [Streptomyces sp. SID4982]|uniref:hypothetical protein n=1 Tax=Streptomyces sp. SID4982 TaxID=2690291 RepID=UPI00136C35B8|nr:hypothetical protein [Streptomyces sp. SID4982]MYS16133.1 hypothetical protein [Streptomyces sp. SID4982]
MNRTALAAVAILAVLTSATACEPTTTTGSSGNTATASATATASTSSGSGNKPATSKTVPNFVGMGLQSAQDTAQSSGFYTLTSHDSLGRARHQVLDRDWKVCSQNLKAGTTAATDKNLNFGAVKLSETCPAHDEAAPTTAGGKMPAVTGKSVAAVRQALDSSTSLTIDDASGQGRMVLLESNWKVCSQTPKAGAALNGQPVTLTAVKFDESC